MQQELRFDSTTLGLVIAAGLIFHLILLILGRRLDTMGVLMGAFFVIAPLSAAILVPGYEYFKWVRVYVSLLILAVAILFYRSWKLGPASLALGGFSMVYYAATIWSENPIQGFMVKGLFIIVVLAALFMAANIRTFPQLAIAIRVTALFSIAWVGMVPLGIALGRADFFVGRLAVWGMNSNRVGHELAAMLLVTGWLAIFDKSKGWKTFGFVASGALALIIAMTGSRASVGMALIAGAFYSIPLLRRPGVLISFWGGAAVLGGVALFLAKSEGTDRIRDFSLDTRQTEWNYALGLWARSPVFGIGWAIDSTSRAAGASQNLHSMYVQTLVESGVLGLGLLLCVLGLIGYRIFRLHRIAWGDPNAGYAYFAMAAAVACLAHGFVESGTIQGSNNNSLLMALGVGLIDRITVMLTEERELHNPAYAQDEYDYAYDEQGQLYAFNPDYHDYPEHDGNAPAA